jgi:formate--tetrahydrofolate ligase
MSLTPLIPISKIAETLGFSSAEIEPYGHSIAKLPIPPADGPIKGKLVLVTATSPNKAGVGKTTITTSLAMGLNHLGQEAVAALREPSLGPCFGMKGGATGGGMAQVLPMDAINLHFTGDFHAITSAHNMLMALLENHQQHQQGQDAQLKRMLWNRVLDVNDRTLRQIITGLGQGNGTVRETGFDITPASELMAVLCLASDHADLEARIGRIVLGETLSGQLLRTSDLGVSGAITALLSKALHPNLVQTTECTPALVHGGPFANIAHGCNSLIATRLGLQRSDWVVTEAGFGSDLGAEKFFNIKCRTGGFQPVVTVLATAARSLKAHGGVEEKELHLPNTAAVEKGLVNLRRHAENLQGFGQTVVVAFNVFSDDGAGEQELVAEWCRTHNLPFAPCRGFTHGGEGAADLAREVLRAAEHNPSGPLQYTYSLQQPVQEKLHAVVQKVYGGASAVLSPQAQSDLKAIVANGGGELPVCIAKTPYAFSHRPGDPSTVAGFDLPIQRLILNAGAGFVVALAGEIMRMPGLPKSPQALHISYQNGAVVGISG